MLRRAASAASVARRLPAVRPFLTVLAHKRDLAKAVSSAELTVAWFTAEWCEPCREMAPHVRSMIADNPEVDWYKVDVDEHAQVTEDSHVTCVPEFILFKGGERVGTVAGARADDLR